MRCNIGVAVTALHIAQFNIYVYKSFVGFWMETTRRRKKLTIVRNCLNLSGSSKIYIVCFVAFAALEFYCCSFSCFFFSSTEQFQIEAMVDEQAHKTC